MVRPKRPPADAIEAGARLREARERQGKTQSQVAAELEVTQAAVSSWETGTSTPDVSRLRDVVRVYAVEYDDVLPEAA